MNIDWKRIDYVLIGRLAGLLVVVGGVALAAWNALDDQAFPMDDSFRWRFFLQSSLSYVGTGGLLILAAEIADRLTWSWDEEEENFEERPSATEGAEDA